MPNTRRGPIPDELGWLIDALDDYAERLRTLEAPSGEALANTVATLQALVTDIQAQLDAYIAGKYTNAQIDDKDAAVVAQIAPAVTSGINAMLAGSPTIGGNLSVTGALGVGSTATVAGAFRNPLGYNTNLTGTRRTAWLQDDGLLGYAASTSRIKTRITEADIDPAAVLSLVPREFYYRPEILRRINLRATYGIEYMPAREVGLLAEEVDEVAPWLTYHDDEGNVEGVEYSMLAVALLAVVRDQEQRLAALEGGAS